MKYVLDSSVAFKWVVVEADTPKARRLRDEFHQGLLELIAPDCLPLEVAHALCRAERQGRLQPAQGSALLAFLLNTLPPLHSSLVLLPRAYQIASQMRIGVYDCLYVALAEQESCELVTADDRLIRSVQGSFSFLVSLASLP